MNIAVAVRLMPKVGDELEVDESGTDIDRELVEMVINEFDDQALEEAVLIKEATGATVTAVGLRADGSTRPFVGVCARGRPVVVVDAGELDRYDSRTAALAFAEAFRQLAPDLVLVGVQTPTDVFGQTAPYLAGRPRLAAGERRRRRHLDRRQPRASCRSTPADGSPCWASSCRPLSASSLPARHPRYVAMARLRQAMTEANTESLAVSIEPPAASTLVSLARPESRPSDDARGRCRGRIRADRRVLRERGALVS